ncbi:hypothetical protein [Mycolicibacterium aubagnense]|uniref:DUF1353 domain-containing protein n=2 Tax=Mycolicibacterium aubagnense TaxID=319707 RepID=A0ABM7IND5_9MYCO|nr:hypothetical protein [Mycolicibacterium aubagnense]TLH48590.1 hypothetical protein C1S80_29670 [Mycolicibacterium aubagnense]BBX88325.1 hypothetical protein MAUB_65260 [Mycolicibacterium aubagnense]
MPAEVFDDQRRAWIAAHTGVFMFQTRRAELLGKRIRARVRGEVGARPDPHDDKITPPLIYRLDGSGVGAVEIVLVLVCAAIAPIGWALGKVLYHQLTRLIPERLRAYPIPALIWASIPCALPLPFYDPTSVALTATILIPWLVAQLPAIFLAAAAYGLLEGWLAVDGSSDWWPLTPEAGDVDDTLFLGADTHAPMVTILDPSPAPPPRRRVSPSTTNRFRTPPTIRWWPMIVGTGAASLLAVWTFFALLSAVLTIPSHLHDTTYTDPFTGTTTLTER